MRSLTLLLAIPLTWALASVSAQDFKPQVIAADLTVGYAVTIVDVNGDKKPDIVVVDSKRVIWYENPTWKVRTIITGKTKPDNVCIAAHDIDGDGQIDFFLGADWAPFNTKNGGTLHWLKRGKTLDEEWTLYPIGEEPTVHRVRMARLGAKGEPQLLLGPLMGKDSTKEGNWLDGRPVRMLAYPIPKDPTKDPWKPVTISEELHVVHNFVPVPTGEPKDNILCASYDGVSLITAQDNGWKTTKIGEGNQANPKGNRGASEIKLGTLDNKKVSVIATIEPWHGNQVVIYTKPHDKKKLWDRHVIDEELRWGHAVWFADLDGDGSDELIIGVRDNAAKTDTFKQQCGVRIYKATNKEGTKWVRTMLDEGGVAVEDLAAADLDGDGKIDIVAVGRATKNARIYWNKGSK